mgnify:CR=1 FL=1
MAQDKKIAFLGTGIMGSRMAHHLLKAGYALTVWNRDTTKAEPLQRAGARVAKTAPEAVGQADIVITMLADPSAVEQVALGAEGFLAAMPEHALWIDCSTVDPEFAQYAHEAAQHHGVRMLDAPVAGSKPQAAEAKLSIFVGGREGDFAEARPVLETMGQKVMHLGDAGAGAAFKMLVNNMLGQAMLAFAETVHLGEAMGFSREMLLERLPQLPVAAPFLKSKAAKLKEEDSDTQFPLALMYKDLHLVNHTAYPHQQPMAAAKLAESLYAQATQAGYGEGDFSDIFYFLGR